MSHTDTPIKDMPVFTVRLDYGNESVQAHLDPDVKVDNARWQVIMGHAILPGRYTRAMANRLISTALYGGGDMTLGELDRALAALENLVDTMREPF